MSNELLAQLVTGGVTALLFWSLNRNVATLDGKLDGLAAKVDTLTATDNQMQVRLAELHVRLTHVEVELQKLRAAARGEGA